jgi:hypothetical protein
MHTYTVDYRERDERDDDGRRRSMVNRGFFAHDVPRLILACRVLGHRPTVDGYGTVDSKPQRYGRHVARWVCCDRCGVRPYPQGNLDPAVWNIGDDASGLIGGYTDHLSADGHSHPGAWPARPAGSVGGQLVICGDYKGLSVETKVGNAGSEHTLAAHLHLGCLFALYLHTERFGAWLQRRLNPTGYDSRVTGVSVHDGRLSWNVWARRNTWSRGTPRWQHGSVRLDPRDHLYGAPRYTYDVVGASTAAVVRMPHGDDHPVTLRLERVTLSRPRGRRKTRSWAANWDSDAGIATKPDNRNRIRGSTVVVSDSAVKNGTWAVEALAAIATDLTAQRRRYGWQPVGAPA